jgi:3-hydroxyacyl-[acyl-carrier-protein] dehydratase
MRFLFCDRIDKVESGDSIVGVKTFSLSEEFLNGHFDRQALVPGTILIETMAQFLGWLIAFSHDFKFLPIITLLDGVSVTPMAPGFEAQVTARMVSTTETDSLGKARIRVDQTVVAEAGRMIYTHFRVKDPGKLRDRFNTMVHPLNWTGSPGAFHG